jgi:hypothetical protein
MHVINRNNSNIVIGETSQRFHELLHVLRILIQSSITLNFTPSNFLFDAICPSEVKVYGKSDKITFYTLATFIKF